MSRARLTHLLVFFAGLLAGCGHAAGVSGPPDAPIPAGEPEEALSVDVDLPAGASCEQDFDLALYQNRGIVLIEWRDKSARCTGRAATIHFLPRSIARTALLELISRHTSHSAASSAPASSSSAPAPAPTPGH